MEKDKITILLIEDDRFAATLIQRFLAQAADVDFTIEHVVTLAEGLTRLAAPGIDLVLLDLLLPNGEGLSVVRQVCSTHPDIPVVIITGLKDDATAVAAIREWAQDYLVKGQFDAKGLVKAVRFAIERHKVNQRFHEISAGLQEAADTVSQLQAFGQQVRKKG